MSKSFSIIVAIAGNNAIGKENKLLWHIPEDLKRFKRITSGHAVIMGKKTFESLPVRPLPGRINIVITDEKSDNFPGCIMAYSIEDSIIKSPDDECFIIGGGSVYRQFLPHAEQMYITKIHKDFEADTYFPEIDLTEWNLTEESVIQIDENSNLEYSFRIYKKLKSPIHNK